MKGIRLGSLLLGRISTVRSGSSSGSAVVLVVELVRGGTSSAVAGTPVSDELSLLQREDIDATGRSSADLVFVGFDLEESEQLAVVLGVAVVVEEEQEDLEEEEEGDRLDFREPPPTGTLRRTPPLVQ
ncbi:hypothetical protein ZOSMA_2G00440 [Zostera marina]|uniref:Uncharacterized protein n=1 Tax=Zostera marina TaxID=29655 RepID=A0A0K9PAB4_ZOSMR|nr:hypothetical protein ZOSMA_2G00440 [Zostera marina]